MRFLDFLLFWTKIFDQGWDKIVRVEVRFDVLF